MWPIISWLTGGVIESTGNAVSNVGKTFWGDAAARDAQVSSEQLAILQQYAAEFAARAQRTWWDSFADGLNRLVRPGLAIGAQAAFVWAAYDPVTFSESMSALQLVPEMMWYVWLTIFSFYFGGRIIATAPKTWKIEPRALEVAKEIAAERTMRAAAAAANAGATVIVSAPSAPAAPVIIEPAPSPVTTTPPAVSDNSQDDVHAVAATIWGEARSEPLAGQIAVGCVIRNRTLTPGWWGSGWRGVCLAPHQFSCWWDQQGTRVRYIDESDSKFLGLLGIAEDIMSGKYDDPTHGADHYYADTIDAPEWAIGKVPTVVIGRHRFFKLGLNGKG